MSNAPFRFKQFGVQQDRCAMKVGTDGVVLGAWTAVAGATRILDIGTGTGLLALMAAQRCPLAWIDAVEIDEASAEQAAANAAASPWADRVRVHRIDVRRLRASAPYDLILCNPPFYAGEMQSPDARTDVAKHGGGLSFPALVDALDALLAPDGRAALIVPLNREDVLLQPGRDRGLRPCRRRVLRYLEGRPPKRVLLELARGEPKVEEEVELVVEHGPGRYSEAYTALLKEFLLRF